MLGDYLFPILLTLLGMFFTFYSGSLGKTANRRWMKITGIIILGIVLIWVRFSYFPHPFQKLAVVIGSILIIVAVIWIVLPIFPERVQRRIKNFSREVAKNAQNYWRWIVLVLILNITGVLFSRLHNDFRIIGAIIGFTGLALFALTKEKKRDYEFLEFAEQTRISASSQNHLEIFSYFLLWESCTILLWVYVTENLKDSPDNRYILAHQTNDPNESEQRNLFALRHSKHNKWGLVFNNDASEIHDTHLRIDDTLEVGWHHFYIAWDHSIPQLVFCIDGCESEKITSSEYRSHWPVNIARTVFVGAWKSPYVSSYCEASLYQLSIYNRFMPSNNSIVKKHFRQKLS